MTQEEFNKLCQENEKELIKSINENKKENLQEIVDFEIVIKKLKECAQNYTRYLEEKGLKEFAENY
jgi:hypothetical protein